MSSPPPPSLTILVLGDKQVGKSTLIQTYASQTPHDHTILAPKSQRETETYIRKANVVVVVYDVTRKETFARVRNYWIPRIVEGNERAPIVLAGNKSDLRANELAIEVLESEILPIMDAYKQVETCVEVSATMGTNLKEMFHFAIRAVVYPTLPLYDAERTELRSPCVDALRRIFRLSDHDGDGLLNDQELNAFQKDVFGLPLTAKELEGIKQVVDCDDGLTEEAFLYLQLLFVQKGNMDTTWTVLRRYGYQETDGRVTRVDSQPLNIHSDEVAELSKAGQNFIIDVFKRYDKDQDGALSYVEYVDAFDTAPQRPWEYDLLREMTDTTPAGLLTLAGWIALFAQLTFNSPSIALDMLFWLGYDGVLLDAISILNRKHHKQRTVFMVHCIGDLQGLNDLVGDIDEKIVTVGAGRSAKWLIMKSISSEDASTTLRNQDFLAKIDLLCLTYNSSENGSFGRLKDLRHTLELNKIPQIFLLRQEKMFNTYPVSKSIESYLRGINLPSPISFTPNNKGSMASLHRALISYCMNSETILPRISDARIWWWLGGSAFALGLGIWFLRFARPNQKTISR